MSELNSMENEMETKDGITKLPDGSAFFTASFPLPKDHWIYAPRGDWDSIRDDFAEKPHPILTNELREHVRAAAKYAIRAATMCGKEMDFDPDAMTQCFTVALCGAPIPRVTERARPTVEELKAILESDDDRQITILPDGSISA